MLELRRYPEAEAAFAAVASRSIEGHLPEDAAIGRAQALEASVDFAGAVAVYEELLQRKLAAPHAVLSRLAAAAEAAGNVPKAIEAFRRVYFEYPLSIESSIAEERADAAQRVERGRTADRARTEARRRAVPGTPLGGGPHLI